MIRFFFTLLLIIPSLTFAQIPEDNPSFTKDAETTLQNDQFRTYDIETTNENFDIEVYSAIIKCQRACHSSYVESQNECMKKRCPFIFNIMSMPQ